MSDLPQPRVGRLIADADAPGPAAFPRRNGELVFEAPWESRAFGLVVALVQEQACDWEEFRQLLIEEVGAWERAHGTDSDQWSYYECWLASFERLLLERGMLSPGDMQARVSIVAREESHEHAHHHHGGQP